MVTFILTTHIVYKHSNESNWNGIGIHPTCIRWRAERNFWICTTNVIVYWATYIIYNVKNTLYEERITRKTHDQEKKEGGDKHDQEEKEVGDKHDEKVVDEDDEKDQNDKNLPSIKGKIISVLKIIDTLNTRAINFVSNEEKLADLETKKNN